MEPAPQPESPVIERSYPAAEPPVQSGPENPSVPPAPPRKHRAALIWLAFVAIALIAGGSYGSYALGYHRGRTDQTAATKLATTTNTLEVPQGATIISQCAIGRGTQYVLPSDIPHGPVYNVYKGKVIGLEYMIGKDDLANNKSYLGLPLYGRAYDHIDVGLLSEGHAGYPEPHYHVDVYTISRAASAAITCK